MCLIRGYFCELSECLFEFYVSLQKYKAGLNQSEEDEESSASSVGDVQNSDNSVDCAAVMENKCEEAEDCRSQPDVTEEAKQRKCVK